MELSGVSKLYQKVRWQKGDWFVLKRARKHVLSPNPSYYMAQAINGEMRGGGENVFWESTSLDLLTHLASFLAARNEKNSQKV